MRQADAGHLPRALGDADAGMRRCHRREMMRSGSIAEPTMTLASRRRTEMIRCIRPVPNCADAVPHRGSTSRPAGHDADVTEPLHGRPQGDL